MNTSHESMARVDNSATLQLTLRCLEPAAAQLPSTCRLCRMQRIRNSACRSYLESLLEYLQDFYVRTQPLQALDKVFKPLDSFDEDFEEGRVGGWEDSGESRLASEAEGQIDLDAFDSVEELLTLGVAPEQLHACLPAAVSPAHFILVGALYDRHKIRLLRYHGGCRRTMPILAFNFYCGKHQFTRNEYCCECDGDTPVPLLLKSQYAAAWQGHARTGVRLNKWGHLCFFKPLTGGFL